MQRAVSRGVPYSDSTLKMVGLVGAIGFPLYYYIWVYLYPQPYESFALRLLGMFLFLPYALIGFWPRGLRRWLPLYWCVTAIYAAPFFFTFMLLQNDMSMVWGMSTMAAILLFVMMINDWLLMTVFYLLGSLLAFAATLWLADTTPDFGAYLVQLPIYTFALVAGGIFNYKQALLHEARQGGMVAVSRNIAHELRTPLLGIRSGIEGLRRYLPALLEGYEAARRAGISVPTIREAHYALLQNLLSRIEEEANYSNTMIDMLLINAGKPLLNLKDSAPHSVRACVETALQRYPFKSSAERRKVQLRDTPDFIFMGSSVLLMHVCFNLLKNALYFIAKAGKGEIEIWTEPGERYNRLHFLDTGTGIRPEDLPHVFDRFYSTLGVGQGTGIGLSFCRMVIEGFGGTLSCRSAYGEYTEFILTLPRTGNVLQQQG